MRRPLALALIVLAGCSSTSDNSEMDRSRPEDRYDVTRPGATFLDGALKVLRMVTPGKGEPFTYYDAELLNTGTSPLSLEVRTIWKDASDRPLGTGEWKQVEIAPGEKKAIDDETTGFPDARFVKLEVRPRS